MIKSTFRLLLTIIISCSIFYSCKNDDGGSSLNSGIIENPIEVSNRTTQVIADWNSLWLEIDRNTEGMRPSSIARALAYIHLAGYETAVADMDGYTSNINRLQDLDISLSQRNENVNLNVALNRCYALVIDHFMFSVSNNAKASIALLRDEKENILSTGLSTLEMENSIEWGTYVAERVIAYSQTDLDAEIQVLDPNPESYVPPVGDGLWVAAEGESAWFPYWRDVRTFVISPDETSSVPPAFTYSTSTTSSCYLLMDEVNQITTAAMEEENEDLWIAEFWSDDVEGLMMSPLGRQFSIANQLIEQVDLGYEESLELFLRLGFAINDAAVSSWDDKYTYNTQRPSTYIRANINSDFNTNLARFISSPNPAFPSYPSGHATFAGASSGVFTNIFGGDDINFIDRTHEGRIEFNGEPRSYNSFLEMAEENAYSRVPLGVHVQGDSDEGIRLGYEVSSAINAFDLND